LLSGQNVLTVPNLQIKRQAQIKGLGVGYLPVHLIREDIAQGRLVVKETEDGMSSAHTVCYAWRSKQQGKAMEWFKKRLTAESHGYDWFGS
jgi:DNA-binding transcriptional LysR family regulator